MTCRTGDKDTANPPLKIQCSWKKGRWADVSSERIQTAMSFQSFLRKHFYLFSFRTYSNPEFRNAVSIRHSYRNVSPIWTPLFFLSIDLFLTIPVSGMQLLIPAELNGRDQIRLIWRSVEMKQNIKYKHQHKKAREYAVFHWWFLFYRSLASMFHPDQLSRRNHRRNLTRILLVGFKAI